MEYRLFFLQPGQIIPKGSTGVCLSNGGIMWVGPEGSFPVKARHGKQLPNDPQFSDEYNHRLASEKEIDEYEDILENPHEPNDPTIT